MGVNPSNKRLRASRKLTKYGGKGTYLFGGGFGTGNHSGQIYSVMASRLFHRIKPIASGKTNLYDKNLMKIFPYSGCCVNRLAQPINNQPKTSASLVWKVGRGKNHHN